MQQEPKVRLMDSQETSSLNFEKDFIRLVIDFRSELGNDPIPIEEFLSFLKKRVRGFEKTTIGKLLGKIYNHVEAVHLKDPKIRIDPIIQTCESNCGTCGCHPTRRCHSFCLGTPPHCTGCGCQVC